MPYRFYCPALVEHGSVTLTDHEAHHLAHVLRQQVGDFAELFNGEGLVATAQVASIRKRDIELTIEKAWRANPPERSLTLATAVPKGDRFDWLVEKATELGVSRLIPMTTTRSVVDPRDGKLEKIRQTVVAACKQSGRNHLMAVSSVMSWDQVLEQFERHQQALIAHPTGRPISSVPTDQSSFLVAVGPEGGYTDDEIESAVAKGAVTISLGTNLLRIETAAIALAAKFLI